MIKEIIDYFEFEGNKIEVKSIIDESNKLTPIIFLHEGLGSVSLWKSWPKKVSLTLKRNVYVYSRLGMGNSSPLIGKRNVNYMHDEAKNVLPNLIDYLGIKSPILIGHSDGASIALIYAGSGFQVEAIILEAPHVFVEDLSIKGVINAKKMWNNSTLKEKLSKHHKDVDGAFNGWSDAWTSEEFKNWNIEKYLKHINIPTMLIQGYDDKYGTMRQLDSISSQIKYNPSRLEIKNCGHSPHIEYPQLVLDNIQKFINSY